jgi:anti-sigma-K factor RskA
MTIPELAMNPIAERLIRVLSRQDRKERSARRENSVNFSQFVRLLSQLAPLRAPRHGQEPDQSVEHRTEKLECACGAGGSS